MKNIFLNIMVIAIAFGGLYARSLMAQDYPTFYNSETGDTTVPNVNFPANPSVCEAGTDDYENCVDTYMDPYAAHLEGYMDSQRPPSPAYTWKDQECILGAGEEAIAKCDEVEDEWQAWNERAVTASLDFVQGPDQSGLVCDDVYDWWGMSYVYKCQDEMYKVQ